MNRSAISQFDAGVACWEKQDVPNAMIHFKSATQIDGSDPRYWVWYGACLMELRHWGQAARVLKKGLSLKPHYGEADAKVMLAEALFNNGEKKATVAELKKVVKMEPMYPSYEAPIEKAKEMLAKW